MGIRLVRGRVFTAQDDAKAPRVAIINETHGPPAFSRTRIRSANGSTSTNGPDTWREIVGIVGDIKQYGVDKATSAQSYEPFAQVPFTSVNVVVRTNGSPAALLGALRPTVYAVDKDQPIGTIRPLEEIMADSIARQRFAMTLLSVFSARRARHRRGRHLRRDGLQRRAAHRRIRHSHGARGATAGRAASRSHPGRKARRPRPDHRPRRRRSPRRAPWDRCSSTPARQDPLTLGTITLLAWLSVALVACLLPGESRHESESNRSIAHGMIADNDAPMTTFATLSGS